MQFHFFQDVDICVLFCFSENTGNIPNTIGETTITVVSQQVNPTISLDPDCEERDEAEGNDDDLEPNSSDDVCIHLI